MATQTTNYEFVKPAGNENPDIIIIDDNMDLLDSEMEKVQATLAYVEPGDTATQNIGEGTFVFWKNALHTALSPIAAGDELNTQVLQPVHGGGFNSARFPRTRSVKWEYTVEADSYVSTDLKTLIDDDLPAGKTCLGIVGFDSGSVNTHIYIMRYATGSSLSIKNDSGSKMSNKTARIYYLYV